MIDTAIVKDFCRQINNLTTVHVQQEHISLNNEYDSKRAMLRNTLYKKKATSFFYSQKMAIEAMRTTMEEDLNAMEIAAWAFDIDGSYEDMPKLLVELNFEASVGTWISGETGTSCDASSVRIILKRTNENEWGFILESAYPIP